MMKVILANKQDGQMVFDSKKDCLDYFGLKMSELENAIEKGMMYRGYCFDELFEGGDYENRRN